MINAKVYRTWFCKLCNLQFFIREAANLILKLVMIIGVLITNFVSHFCHRNGNFFLVIVERQIASVLESLFHVYYFILLYMKHNIFKLMEVILSSIWHTRFYHVNPPHLFPQGKMFSRAARILQLSQARSNGELDTRTYLICWYL